MADADVSGSGRGWLGSRKVTAALFIAAIEGLLLLFGRLSRWVLIVIAIPIVLTYLFRGRQMRPRLGRNVLWIVAFSQALVLLVAILAFFIVWGALTRFRVWDTRVGRRVVRPSR